ncbi:tetratricopeptide repeat protein [Hippea sp. KM1]|uniref:tetratricopeptide repeat protein n=1 Tax=Hippea sp. KM1 TaxID=944481 RepID=UPI00046D3DA2|nr:tetratricopeptide repeat protein [Hippea sp. KM1]
MPQDAYLYVKGRYFVAFFAGKRVKKEFIAQNLKDAYFKSFYIENNDNSSQIVIECNKGYQPDFEKQGDVVIVKPSLQMAKHKAEPLKGVPQELIAIPFYTSQNTFSPTQKFKQTYDEMLFFSGIRAFYIKNYRLAAAFFREIIKKYPSSNFFINAYFLLGDCYKNLKQYDMAIKTYESAIKFAPKNSAVAQTLFSMADIYIKRKMYMSARNIYKRIMKDYADTEWYYKAEFMLGYSYYTENRCRNALKVFLNVDKKSKFYPVCMLISAECFFRQKDYAKAVLAYYYMSKKLESINPEKFYVELGDVGIALCEYEDYKEANRVFSYAEQTHKEEIIEHIYIDRMRCDLKKGDFDDLNYRGKYILKFSKDAKLKAKARKLMDEGKLKKGDVDKKTIDEIMAKYKNDPEVVSLALYVYAKKNYRQKDYSKALEYMAKLKKLYSDSKYNKLAIPMAADSINKLLDRFYKMPSMDTIDRIYAYARLLKPDGADYCRLSWALVFTHRVGYVSKFMYDIKDELCKNTVIAKYYVEVGNNLKASDVLNGIPQQKPYIDYINMIFGDINYFNGDYNKAYDFYNRAIKNLSDGLMKDYLRLRLARVLYQLNRFEDAEGVLSQIRVRIYSDYVVYLKGLCEYKLKHYKNAIEILSNVENNLRFKEKVLFYKALSYLKMGDKKKAKEAYRKLYRTYPNSEYVKILKALLL